MPKEKVSKMTKWSETEKLQVLLSIINNSTKIDWENIYIPEGRSLKAVKCMLDGVRKAAGTPGSNVEGKNKDPSSKPATRAHKRKQSKKMSEEIAADDEEEFDDNRVKKAKLDSEMEEDIEVEVKEEEDASEASTEQEV